MRFSEVFNLMFIEDVVKHVRPVNQYTASSAPWSSYSEMMKPEISPGNSVSDSYFIKSPYIS